MQQASLVKRKMFYIIFWKWFPKWFVWVWSDHKAEFFHIVKTIFSSSINLALNPHSDPSMFCKANNYRWKFDSFEGCEFPIALFFINESYSSFIVMHAIILYFHPKLDSPEKNETWKLMKLISQSIVMLESISSQSYNRTELQ